MDKKQRNFIMGHLRNLSKKSPTRYAAKQLRKRGPMTFECDVCGVWFYEGKKTLEKAKIKLKIPNNVEVKVGKVEMDHEIPVGKFDDWNGWIGRLFCNLENWSCKCRDCHKIKTDSENQERKENRRKNETK